MAGDGNFLIQLDLEAKMLDEFDRKILATLQVDSSLSMQEIADRVGSARPLLAANSET